MPGEFTTCRFCGKEIYAVGGRYLHTFGSEARCAAPKMPRAEPVSEGGPTREQLINAARDLYASNSSDDIEIDDDARLSPNDQGGTWVAAWVWVNHEEVVGNRPD